LVRHELTEAARLIRHRLREMHWTQLRLAEAAGMSTYSMTRMMRGQQTIDADTAVRIEHLTGLPAEEIALLQLNEQMQQIRDQIQELEAHAQSMPGQAYDDLVCARRRFREAGRLQNAG
jgi:plasmid maintenance system antidote protein VapI